MLKFVWAFWLPDCWKLLSLLSFSTVVSSVIATSINISSAKIFFRIFPVSYLILISVLVVFRSLIIRSSLSTIVIKVSYWISYSSLMGLEILGWVLAGCALLWLGNFFSQCLNSIFERILVFCRFGQDRWENFWVICTQLIKSVSRKIFYTAKIPENQFFFAFQALFMACGIFGFF